MGRVVVAGVVSVRIARPVESFPVPHRPSEKQPGQISVRLASTGWTITRTLQQLGSDVDLATYVGADPLGHLAVTGLRQHGLYRATTQVCAEQPRAVVLYDPKGNRAGARDLRFVPDLCYPIDVFTAALDAAPGCDLAVLGNVAFTRPLIAAAQRRGVPIATDVQLATDIDTSPHQDWLRAAHLLACSHEALTGGAEDWIVRLWHRFGTPLALVGCGGRGALVGVRATRQIWHVPAAPPRGVVYTSGAGDTLFASFIHHYLVSGDPVLAARYGVLAASWKVGGLPDEEPGVPAAVLAELVSGLGLPAADRLR
ncbi:MAG TPA: carbohydrate kinase family protein [Pseudonocardiaceae bacterium]|jgi:sugar/nucleoside kinase (ribokinase family)|nr:carbohydrate kinase family protein [Pseudonocardiaceae bacterium]